MTKKHIMTLAGVLGLSVVAHGAVIAYEGFDYAEPNGTTLTGLNGGTGWDEAYPGSIGNYQLADGLSFSGMTTTGKSTTRSTGANLTAGGRNWASSVPVDSTVWYSFLLKATTSSGGTFGILQNDYQNGFGVTIRTSDYGVTNIPAGSLAIQATTGWGGGWINLGNSAATFDKTYLIVGKLALNSTGDSHNDVWVYDSLPTTEGQAGLGTSASWSTLGTKNAAMYGRAWGGSSLTAFDEVRIGDNFIDVIPEPATLGLVGMIGIGLIAVRRFFTI